MSAFSITMSLRIKVTTATFAGFSGFYEALIFRFATWVVACGDKGRHVKRTSDIGPSALNETTPFNCPR